MTWPTAQDYQEAVQNPQINFADQELQHGSVNLDKHGLPAVRAGRFATVYSLDSGRRQVAVRCFLQNYPDHRLRYQEIAAHLAVSKLPYTVSFDYLEKGVLVSGTWYPVLKMSWVEGDPFLAYIERHRHDSAKLMALANDWLQMTRRLGFAGIAHGDLQHGNIIIAEEKIKLVDYDGMYVPALQNCQSKELGHANYQHPGRTDRHFGSYLDNFSAWLIHASIICLAIDPSLWDQVQQRDEFILFHKRDLESPGTSPIVQILSGHDAPQIRSAAETLKHLLALLPEELPPPEDIAISGARVDQTIDEHLRALGLDSLSTESQVQAAALVWRRVWAPEHFKHNKELKTRAAEKLRAISDSIQTVEKAQKQQVRH